MLVAKVEVHSGDSDYNGSDIPSDCSLMTITAMIAARSTEEDTTMADDDEHPRRQNFTNQSSRYVFKVDRLHGTRRVYTTLKGGWYVTRGNLRDVFF